eukprot:m.161443 g.161443  ORF g.161443 m.161443 type:complete len:838 (-) comp17645_c1_seq1:107-2620(-)
MDLVVPDNLPETEWDAVPLRVFVVGVLVVVAITVIRAYLSAAAALARACPSLMLLIYLLASPAFAILMLSLGRSLREPAHDHNAVLVAVIGLLFGSIITLFWPAVLLCCSGGSKQITTVTPTLLGRLLRACVLTIWIIIHLFVTHSLAVGLHMAGAEVHELCSVAVCYLAAAYPFSVALYELQHGPLAPAPLPHMRSVLQAIRRQHALSHRVYVAGVFFLMLIATAIALYFFVDPIKRGASGAVLPFVLGSFAFLVAPILAYFLSRKNNSTSRTQRHLLEKMDEDTMPRPFQSKAMFPSFRVGESEQMVMMTSVDGPSAWESHTQPTTVIEVSDTDGVVVAPTRDHQHHADNDTADNTTNQNQPVHENAHDAGAGNSDDGRPSAEFSEGLLSPRGSASRSCSLKAQQDLDAGGRLLEGETIERTRSGTVVSLPVPVSRCGSVINLDCVLDKDSSGGDSDDNSDCPSGERPGTPGEGYGGTSHIHSRRRRSSTMREKLAEAHEAVNVLNSNNRNASQNGSPRFSGSRRGSGVGLRSGGGSGSGAPALPDRSLKPALVARSVSDFSHCTSANGYDAVPPPTDDRSFDAVPPALGNPNKPPAYNDPSHSVIYSQPNKLKQQQDQLQPSDSMTALSEVAEAVSRFVRLPTEDDEEWDTDAEFAEDLEWDFWEDETVMSESQSIAPTIHQPHHKHKRTRSNVSRTSKISTRSGVARFRTGILRRLPSSSRDPSANHFAGKTTVIFIAGLGQVSAEEGLQKLGSMHPAWVVSHERTFEEWFAMQSFEAHMSVAAGRDGGFVISLCYPERHKLTREDLEEFVEKIVLGVLGHDLEIGSFLILKQ